MPTVMPTMEATEALDALEMLETLERLAQLSDFEVSDEYDEPFPPGPSGALKSGYVADWEQDAHVVNISSGGKLLRLPSLPSEKNIHTPSLEEKEDKSDPWTWWNELKTREMR